MNKGIKIILKRLLKYLACTLPVFAAIGIEAMVLVFFSLGYYLMVAVLTTVKLSSKGITNPDEIMEQIQRAMLSAEMNHILEILAVVICGVVFIFWYKNTVKYERKIKYSSVINKKNIGIIVLVGMGGQFTTAGLLSAILPYLEWLNHNYSEAMESIVSGSLITVIISTVLVAPVVEELIFRGVILHKMRKVIPFLGANISQAAIFGICHLNIVQGLYAFGIGLILGYVAKKFKTIFAPMVLHMTLNATGFLVSAFPDAFITYLILMVFGAALLVFGLYRIKMAQEPLTVAEEPNPLLWKDGMY